MTDSQRFRALCEKIRNGHATWEEREAAWDIAMASDRDYIRLIPKWPGPPVDDLEHALAMVEWT